MHTGDLALLDGAGYCSIVGRIKDMVIRGGAPPGSRCLAARHAPARASVCWVVGTRSPRAGARGPASAGCWAVQRPPPTSAGCTEWTARRGLTCVRAVPAAARAAARLNAPPHSCAPLLAGENIYPREVEEFLHRHPAVAEVQVRPALPPLPPLWVSLPLPGRAAICMRE